MWQDPATAVLLALGAGATWSMAFSPATVVKRRHSVVKGASALGFAVINASLGLYLSSLVSLQYVAAFAWIGWRRSGVVD